MTLVYLDPSVGGKDGDLARAAMAQGFKIATYLEAGVAICVKATDNEAKLDAGGAPWRAKTQQARRGKNGLSSKVSVERQLKFLLTWDEGWPSKTFCFAGRLFRRRLLSEWMKKSFSST